MAGLDEFANFAGDPFNTFSGVPFTTNQSAPSANIASAFQNLQEFEPDIPFQGALRRANLSPNLQRRFQGQRQQFFGQFQALLDEQIRAGQLPNASFAEFANNIDFRREAFNLSPSDRFGAGSATRFSPRTQFGR